MLLWMEWWNMVCLLRKACTREMSFMWLVATLAGVSIRSDIAGVTSIIRSLGFLSHCYDRVLDFYHSSAVNVDCLMQHWVKAVLKSVPGIHRVGGRIILLADGIKVAKSGRKMPAVKLLHQVSESNTKPEYIMGHSIQVISILVEAASSFFAIPLAARIHEGLVFSNRDTHTLTDKMNMLLDGLGVNEPFYFVADAYYACKTIVHHLIKGSGHLISRVKNNAVAYEPVIDDKKGPGRPKQYGNKIKLSMLFNDGAQAWQFAQSPIYGEKDVEIKYLCQDLLWRPIGKILRFILVIHPTRGKIILFCSDIFLCPLEIIRIYGLRFKIELSFKQALRLIGTYAYHFWMSAMKPIRRKSGNQYPHRESEKYRKAIVRKLNAYHRHIQIGIIAQGLLQYLAIKCPKLVWTSFGSWLRTIRPGLPPSELVTMNALRNTLPEFLLSSETCPAFKKFMCDRIDYNRFEGLRLAG